jgi:hypothetical protein
MMTYSGECLYTSTVAKEIYGKDPNKHGLFATDAPRIALSAWIAGRTIFCQPSMATI